MNRLLIVSNRLPISVSRQNGDLRLQRSVGGLATGVGSFYKSYESVWVGWPGMNVQKKQNEEREQIIEALRKEQCHPVFLSPYDIKHYYDGFCNNTLWPIFHYFSLFADYNKKAWNVYQRVNEKFCDAVMEVARPDDIIWVHDYHLMLLPQMLRERLPDAEIGYFHHIPFPSFEVFRNLPWRKELLEGMLGADLIGFHTYGYVRHFLSSVRRILGYEHSFGEVRTGTRVVRTDLFPMGIDYRRFADAASSTPVQGEIARIRQTYGGRKIILSFDRLDYTKGIPLRLEAFDALLEKKPEYRGMVSLILVAVPSRAGVGRYQALKKRIDELVGRINGKYGTTDWVPVRYFYNFLPFETLVAFYSAADVALVTPLRDGMNLMAKEYVATRTDGTGVLILSEMAGAAEELGEAVIVNPNDQDAVIEAIETALAMPEKEQVERNRAMQKRLMRYDIEHWVGDFLTRLGDARAIQVERSEQVVTPAIMDRLVADYATAENRLLLLDYDGTLVPFAAKPRMAVPGEATREVLEELSRVPGNEVVVISGRDRHTLDAWFGAMDIGLIAEHGVWVKERSGEWRMPETLSGEWKGEIYPILELYTDRTPGAFIEEKDYSLVWHYRRTEPMLGAQRAKDLKDDLLHLTSNLNVGVMEGNKVIEIKNTAVNKGRAALNWISRHTWDFILAIGDDRTDEDLFEVVPSEAYSIKVGLAPSKARFNLVTQRDVISLLRRCIACDRGDIRKKEKPEREKDLIRSAAPG
ncbi:MAG TPA: bifunctional alpha,alpha-trehalose-phosphate synthase (UDP-forming)/trehalose-phosphatase [Candidatus Methanoculleus thermohydrogenotrophicum]|jgi:trehalose 6-phosphate synthase/phosphatase|nr:bifunctional alpha,alpha-trehalose-phosphate synthase (UDP-forming)/trehalose-phosphatase [Candidatus Methanoculleus thermohydrogenotrophicum]HOB18272.1 bifunctional alpha,alpha-trehalose-phosphate synthase (UDP-forming)/trehalose-phosphatase [Candidatus Methanoculleus thermohydrogenotrophicum]HPZ38388.1 bifunctional alpha,alpha-trehalose-phosphate synthase (UDP-forming)/trehalose-phosphatase [Candidatus Methanoculleus thermohydrogenotrophicum]HQC91523.1 bifunctional alpha,alpha-trehalose-pho